MNDSMPTGTFAQNYATDKQTISSLQDVGEQCQAARKKLFDGLDALAPGLIGAAGSAAQNFKTNIDEAIGQINTVGDQVAEALVTATNQSSSDDEAAGQQLNTQMGQLDDYKGLLSSGQ